MIGKYGDLLCLSCTMRKCYIRSYELISLFRIDTEIEVNLDRRIESHRIRPFEEFDRFFQRIHTSLLDEAHRLIILFPVFL